MPDIPTFNTDTNILLNRNAPTMTDVDKAEWNMEFWEHEAYLTWELKTRKAIHDLHMAIANML